MIRPIHNLAMVSPRAFWLLITSPVVIVFISSNFVNFGNLIFNVIFSRWMGPELFGDLAVILTLKLAILSVFSALQMAITSQVAKKGRKLIPALGKLNSLCFIALWFILPIVMMIVWVEEIGLFLGLTHPHILFIILLSLPFVSPLSFARGVVYGQLDIRGILLSSNVEMLVRLGGAIVAWRLGLGIEGVSLSIGLSILFGWLVIAKNIPFHGVRTASINTSSRVMFVIAIPFALLQLSQVIMLDGDIFVVKALLNSTVGGYFAALSLFQRIEFFACFGLVSVLLPAVTTAVREGKSILQAVMPVIILFILITVFLQVIISIWPGYIVTMMVGADFIAITPVLSIATFSAAVFTFNYLLATFCAAMEDYLPIWFIFFCAPIQLLVLGLTCYWQNNIAIEQILFLKLGCQIIVCFGLLSYIIYSLTIFKSQKIAVDI